MITSCRAPPGWEGEEDKQACKDCSSTESKEYKKGSWPHSQVLRLFHLFISKVGQSPGCLSCALHGQELSEALVLMGPAHMLRVDRAQEGGCLPGTKHLVTRLTGKSALSAAGSHGNVPGSIILSEHNLGLK